MVHPNTEIFHRLTKEQQKVIREFRDAMNVLRRETGLEQVQRALAPSEQRSA